MRVSGLAPVEGIHGLENIDVTKLVNGHMAYRAAMPKLLREVGWEVESDEFTEIEDPDPENHDKRQRELIRELDEARKEAEVKPGKRRFGFFKKGKLAEKKTWETYDDSMRKDEWGTSSADNGSSILFDVEAIKAELRSEQIEVRQLESTLPPMKLNLEDQPPLSLHNSFDAVQARVQERRGCGTEPSDHDGARSQVVSPSLTNGHENNPFDRGYDEYNLSAEAVVSPLSATHSKVSFESSLASPSPRRSWLESSRPPSAIQETIENTATPHTPPLKSPLAISSPHSNDVPLEHNAWADEDDPDFGKEQEVKLTF